MLRSVRVLAACGMLVLSPLGRGVLGDERLAGIACRSVHLQYPAPEATAFYNEIAVEQSAEGTYFCVCGFNMGYFGIQELADGKKVAIFSVWDPGRQDDPNSVAEDRRVAVLEQGEGVRVRRFGNEGTGAQSFLDLDWQVGQTYRFLVTARPEGDRTAFSAFVGTPDRSGWRLMAAFATLADGKLLRGEYSFVEDFRRNRVSATQERKARFGNGWVRGTDGTWHPLDRARFTADSNPATNIDAGTEGAWFFLATGGATENRHTPLGEWITKETSSTAPPAILNDLPAPPGRP